MLEALNPLEVADGHPAGVAQDVGDDGDVPLVEDLVGLRRRGAVGPLGHDLRLDLRRVVAGDGLLQGGGDQDVALQLQDLLVGQGIRSREAHHAPGLGLVETDRLRVQPVGVEDGAPGVADGHDGGALLIVEEAGRVVPHVPVALDGDGGRAEVHLQALGGLPGGVHDPPGRGLLPPLGPPNDQGLPRHHAGHGVSLVHAEGVHDPGHDLGVGVDVRGGDVLLRTDDDGDLRGEAARQALQLPRAHLLGVADDAPLGPAVGQADDGALPGHPGGQGPHLVQGDVGVVPDAPLEGAEGLVVLHAVAGEDADGAVVHLYGEVHGELPARQLQYGQQARVQLEAPSHGVDLDTGNVERAQPRSLGHLHHSVSGGNSPCSTRFIKGRPIK